MKIIRFADYDGNRHYGVLADDGSAQVVEGDIFGKWRVGETVLRIEQWLAPVDPPNIFGIGLNYRSHAAEGNRPVPDKPLIFTKATTSVIGPRDPIILPTSAPDEVDLEAELAVVIGRQAKNVPPDQVDSVILGYTCANDVTARDCQKRLDSQWTRAKGFDTFCPLGPCIVPTAEIDPQTLWVSSTLNGEQLQRGCCADMVFSVSHLVSYLSHQFTLLPGTIICTGTPAGVGYSRNPPIFLRAGDTVAVEISGIGALSNFVVKESEPSAVDCPLGAPL